jgi:hypothetical protein
LTSGLLEEAERPPGKAGIAVEQQAVSPELALVDPVLGQRAREDMMHTRAVEAPWADSIPSRATAARSHVVAERSSDSTLQPTRRGRLRPLTGAFVPLVVAAVTLFVQGDRLVATGRQGGLRPQPALADATPQGRAQVPFGWARVPQASYYVVRFYRSGTKVFEARPRTTRLVLPRNWSLGAKQYRLRPGRYHWSVRPGFGSPSSKRIGKPIVDADWFAGRAPGR